MSRRPGSKTATSVWAIERERGNQRRDHLATEEPMEIRLVAHGVRRAVAVTMRTPGHDFELAVGFLYGEGVVGKQEDIARISYCLETDSDAAQQYNIVNVGLRPHVAPDLTPLERRFYTTSACGVCGKASLEALQMRSVPAIPPGPEIPAAVLYGLPDKLRRAQGVFEKTGGLHAAALFDTDGQLVAVREDVGRHNAVDKLVGWALLAGKLPLRRCILLVSGRASFEIVQKCVAAGIPIVCAVSAPSSLAVDLAHEYGITLIGFLRGERCNVYTRRERVTLPAASEPPAI
ncbi:MAG TPA: formate dehydrogenase accessory sulfurtransferase FdhD [Thermomicrobiales bacterium]|nr:formate dehydrogenase accessory sulfurtransferase FdhD [Thermomicrobiales bacterium]